MDNIIIFVCYTINKLNVPLKDILLLAESFLVFLLMLFSLVATNKISCNFGKIIILKNLPN